MDPFYAFFFLGKDPFYALSMLSGWLLYSNVINNQKMEGFEGSLDWNGRLEKLFNLLLKLFDFCTTKLNRKSKNKSVVYSPHKPQNGWRFITAQGKNNCGILGCKVAYGSIIRSSISRGRIVNRSGPLDRD